VHRREPAPAPGIPDFIGPVRYFRKRLPAGTAAVREAVILQQFADLGARLPIEVAVGDFTDQPMSFRAPGKRALDGRREREQRREDAEGWRRGAAPFY